MSKLETKTTEEETAELKIKVPKNWLKALEEIHEKLGWDLEDEGRTWLMEGMKANAAELDDDLCDKILKKYHAAAMMKEQAVSKAPAKNPRTPKQIKVVVFGADDMNAMDYYELQKGVQESARKLFPHVPCDVSGWGLKRYSILEAVAGEIGKQAAPE